LIANVGAQATCDSTSPQCCWVVRSWQLMGKNTTVSSGSGYDCCSMDGVSCSGSHVTAIKWNYKGLAGSIPVEIGNLKNLTDL
jgi:hypothetical protein